MDLASLAIKIDTTDVNNAIAQLNNLAQAAKKVDDSFSGSEGKSKSYIQSLVQQVNAVNNLTQSIDKHVDSAKKSASLYENMVAKLTMTKEAYQEYTLSLKGLDDQEVKHITDLTRAKQAEEGLTAALKEHSATVRKATSDYNDMLNKLTMSKEAYEALKLFQSGWNAEQIKTIQNLQSEKSSTDNLTASQKALAQALDQTLKADRARQSASASTFKDQSGPQIQALNQRLALEQSIRMHGADDVRTLELRSSQEQIAIRQRLNAELLRLENALRDGTITNRGQANLMRQNALRIAEQELTANNIAIESTRRLNDSHSEFNRILGKTHDMLIRMAAYRGINFIFGAPSAILDVNVRMESLRVQLEGITGSAGQAKDVFKELLALDIKTPFDIEGLAQTWIRLKNYGLEPTRDVMKSLTDGVARLGGGTDILNRVSLQLGQAWAKNKLQLQDMKPMMDAGIPVLQILADKMHVGAGAVLEMSRAGTIGHKEIMLLLKGIEEWAPDATIRAMDTLKGSISNVKTAWIQFQDALLETKGESAVKDFFVTLSNDLFYWTNKLKENETATVSWAKQQKEVNELIKAQKVLEEHPILAKVSALGLIPYDFGVSSMKLLAGVSDAQIKVAQSDLEMMKASDLAKKEIEAKNFSVKKDLELAEQSEKAINAQVKALEALESVNKSIADAENARIDAKVKTVGILSGLTVKQYEDEYKHNQDSFKNQELSQTVYLDKQMQLIEAIKNAKLKAIDEESILIKSKTNEQIDDVQKALDVIHTIESGNGRPGQEVNRTSVNIDNWTLGAGQAKISTLRDPGVKGMLPYGDMESIDKIKGNYDALVEYVKTHQADLTAWSDKYFTQLVVKYGSVMGSLKQYGEGTDAYNKKFISMYNDHIGATKQQISLDQTQMEKELEKNKIIAESTAAQNKLKDDLISKSKEYGDALENERVKLLQSQGKNVEANYLSAYLGLQQNKNYQSAVKTGDTKSASVYEGAAFGQFDKKDMEDKQKGLDDYNKSINDINESMIRFSKANTDVFDSLNSGFGNLARVLEKTAESINNADKVISSNREKAAEDAANLLIPEEKRADLAKKHSELDKKLTKDKTALELSSVASIAGAASKMFGDKTAAAKAFHAIEIALSVASLAMKAKEIAMEIGSLASKGVSAILNQGNGDPYSAFPRIAAMTAIVGGIIAMAGAGGAFSGGSGASTMPSSSADTGTSLGDSSAQSQSVNNTYNLLKSIHADEYVELKGINKGVGVLVSGITDTVTRLFQSGGLNAKLSEDIKSSASSSSDPGISILSGLFGGATKSVVGGGIGLTSALVSELLNGYQLSGSQFTTTKSEKSGFLGMGSKTTYAETYSPLDKSVTSALTDVLKASAKTMLDYAVYLNKDLQQNVLNYKIPMMRIDLAGLNGDDAVKKVTGVISTMLDTMSTDIFGSMLKQYQLLGEGMFETTGRIITEMAVAKDVLRKSNLQLTGDIIGISDALVQAAGGVEEFKKQFDSYFDKFYSDGEKQSYLQDQIARALVDVNLTLPVTREGYRAIIQALDMTNELDQQRYSILIKQSEAADKFFSSIEEGMKSLESPFDNLAKTFLNLTDYQQYSLDRINAKIFEADKNSPTTSNFTADAISEVMKGGLSVEEFVMKINNANIETATAIVDYANMLSEKLSILNKNLDIAYNDLSASVAAEKTKATDNMNQVKQVADNIKSALASTIVESDTLNYKRRKDAQAVIESAVITAKAGGSLVGFAGLDDALKTIAKPSQQFFKTFTDYARDQGRTAANLEILQTVADKQVTKEQEYINYLDKQLTEAKTQVDLLRGIDSGIKDLATSTLAFEGAKNAVDGANGLVGIFGGQSQASLVEAFSKAISAGLTVPGITSNIAHKSKSTQADDLVNAVVSMTGSTKTTAALIASEKTGMNNAIKGNIKAFSGMTVAANEVSGLMMGDKAGLNIATSNLINSMRNMIAANNEVYPLIAGDKSGLNHSIKAENIATQLMTDAMNKTAPLIYSEKSGLNNAIRGAITSAVNFSAAMNKTATSISPQQLKIQPASNSNDDLKQQIIILQGIVAQLLAENQKTSENTRSMKDNFNRVTTRGNYIDTKAVA